MSLVERRNEFALLYLRILTLFALALASGHLHAEHEADHRYVVEGYVLDAGEKPLADVTVSIRRPEGFLGSAGTNLQGFYRVRLHLHNEDLGKQLTVRAGDNQTVIEVEFDPADRTTARVHRLSFIGSRAVEKDLGFRGVPVWVYVAAAALLVLVAAAYTASRIRKRRRKQTRLAEKEVQKPHKKKGKKGKR